MVTVLFHNNTIQMGKSCLASCRIENPSTEHIGCSYQSFPWVRRKLSSFWLREHFVRVNRWTESIILSLVAFEGFIFHPDTLLAKNKAHGWYPECSRYPTLPTSWRSGDKTSACRKKKASKTPVCEGNTILRTRAEKIQTHDHENTTTAPMTALLRNTYSTMIRSIQQYSGTNVLPSVLTKTPV